MQTGTFFGTWTIGSPPRWPRHAYSSMTMTTRACPLKIARTASAVLMPPRSPNLSGTFSNDSPVDRDQRPTGERRDVGREWLSACPSGYVHCRLGAALCAARNRNGNIRDRAMTPGSEILAVTVAATSSLTPARSKFRGFRTSAITPMDG